MICNVSDKLDGASLILTYVDGQLKTAVTRGNGMKGDDITPNAVQFFGVQPRIAYPGTIVIRGEAIMPQSVFKAHYFDGKNNARNVTNGLIKAREIPAGKSLADVHFVAYDLIGTNLPTETKKLECLKDWGFETPAYATFNTLSEVEEYFHRRSAQRAAGQLPYTIDGLVIKIDDLSQQNHFDVVDGCPRGQVALKFPPATVIATVEAIEWEMGNSGRFCPVARVTPILLGGEVTLKRVSLHNLEQLRKLKITPGAKIIVERAGDVIPHVVGVHTEGKPFYKKVS